MHTGRFSFVGRRENKLGCWQKGNGAEQYICLSSLVLLNSYVSERTVIRFVCLFVFKLSLIKNPKWTDTCSISIHNCFVPLWETLLKPLAVKLSPVILEVQRLFWAPDVHRCCSFIDSLIRCELKVTHLRTRRESRFKGIQRLLNQPSTQCRGVECRISQSYPTDCLYPTDFPLWRSAHGKDAACPERRCCINIQPPPLLRSHPDRMTFLRLSWSHFVFPLSHFFLAACPWCVSI